MNATLAAIVAVLTALGGSAGFVALLTARATRRRILADASKSDAEQDLIRAQAAEILKDTALDLLRPAREQITRLRAQLRETESEVATLRRVVDTLTKELEARIAELEAERAENARLREHCPEG